MNSHPKIIFFVLIVYTLFTFGCKNPFNPEMKYPQDSNIQENVPESVLIKLMDSYKRKDIELYKECLAEDFEFQMLSSEIDIIGLDLNNDGMNDEWWGYEQEIEFHENLFIYGSSSGLKSPDLIELSIVPLITEPWLENGTEVGVMINCSYTLDLTLGSGLGIISSKGNTTYFLKQYNDQWKIKIWRDESVE